MLLNFVEGVFFIMRMSFCDPDKPKYKIYPIRKKNPKTRNDKNAVYIV